MAYIKIDSDVMRGIITANGDCVTAASKKFGRSDTYFGKIMLRGTMQDNALDHFCEVYGVDKDSVLYHEPIPEPKEEPTQLSIDEHRGYWTDLQFYPNKVKLTLNFTECGATVEVAHAYSKIKGESELNIVQAISYAAHMVYKIVEQNQLGK